MKVTEFQLVLKNNSKPIVTPSPLPSLRTEPPSVPLFVNNIKPVNGLGPRDQTRHRRYPEPKASPDGLLQTSGVKKKSRHKHAKNLVIMQVFVSM